jgi:hypothetical protein
MPVKISVLALWSIIHCPHVDNLIAAVDATHRFWSTDGSKKWRAVSYLAASNVVLQRSLRAPPEGASPRPLHVLPISGLLRSYQFAQRRALDRPPPPPSSWLHKNGRLARQAPITGTG